MPYVDIVGQPGWRIGASVNGQVVLGQLAEEVVVPETSVVLRPAGEVVYLISNKTALQRIVKTGLRQDGMVQITQGLNSGETVAVDGAAFLTDKAPVSSISNQLPVRAFPMSSSLSAWIRISMFPLMKCNPKLIRCYADYPMMQIRPLLPSRIQMPARSCVWR